jgi:serine protease inhibitor
MRALCHAIAAQAAMLAAFMLVAACLAGPAGAEAVAPGQARAFAERMNLLGSETLGRLAGKRGDSTIIVSPYGLGSALHLLGIGAAAEAERSLHGRLLPSGVEPGQQDPSLIVLRQHILGANRERLRLTLANAVFVPRAAVSSRRFLARARDVFAASVEAVDFGSASALERINAWAQEATRGAIPRVLDEVDGDARFVLTNAVYFNGAWATAFEPGHTASAPFTRVDGSTRDAPIMDATIPAAFAELGKLDAVWLPYEGREVAMLIIAPGRAQGPNTVAEALRGRSLASLMSEAQQKRRAATVRVRLPRFRAESGLDLTDALSSLGLAPAFSRFGNYAAINKARSGPLQVTQRVVLEVTESGATAAAATTVSPDRSLSITPLLSADRPFAFAIVHAPTEAVLFAGYVADPGDDPALVAGGHATRR